MNKAGILPFGYMADRFNEALAAPPPTAWRADAEPLGDWIERMLVIIQDEVWPVWAPWGPVAPPEPPPCLTVPPCTPVPLD